MTGAPDSRERRFSYRAVKPSGERVADVLRARDRNDALARLATQKLVVTDLKEDSAGEMSAPWSRPTIRARERVLVLRQLAVMIRAGVELLEALETIGESLGDGPMGEALRAVAISLRRGERISKAFAGGLPGYPPYVYALIGAGEASGKLDRVLEEAAAQIAFEDRIRRDVINALTYPAFLIGAGVLAVSFLFYTVVPRFAEMLGSQRVSVSGISAVVLSMGEGFHEHAPLILAGVAIAVFALITAGRSPGGRRAIGEVLERAPIIGSLIDARVKSSWARIMAFASGAGVGILEAATLAQASTADGRFRGNLARASSALRAGRNVDQAFSAALAPIDVSLLRVGQRSGALPEMFRAIADRHEEDLRDALKRLTALVEPIAIGFVALAIASVVLALVTAMTSLYDSIG